MLVKRGSKYPVSDAVDFCTNEAQRPLQRKRDRLFVKALTGNDVLIFCFAPTDVAKYAATVANMNVFMLGIYFL
jgi:hypothetical protein